MGGRFGQQCQVYSVARLKIAGDALVDGAGAEQGKARVFEGVGVADVVVLGYF